MDNSHYQRILERHEDFPTGYDLNKIAFKEEVFRRWCLWAERVRDIIQEKRTRKQKEVEARHRAKCISQLVRVISKVGRKKAIIERDRVQFRTISALINSPKGTLGTIKDVLTIAGMEDIDTSKIIVNLSLTRYGQKHTKAKAHRKFLGNMIAMMEKVLINRGVNVDQESINSFLQGLSPEELKEHEQFFQMGYRMTGKRSPT